MVHRSKGIITVELHQVKPCLNVAVPRSYTGEPNLYQGTRGNTMNDFGNKRNQGRLRIRLGDVYERHLNSLEPMPENVVAQSVTHSPTTDVLSVFPATTKGDKQKQCLEWTD